MAESNSSMMDDRHLPHRQCLHDIQLVSYHILTDK